MIFYLNIYDINKFFIRLKNIFLLLFCFILSGCQIFAGAGLHSNQVDQRNIDQSNIVFTGLATQNIAPKVDLYFEHNSALDNSDSGLGLNTAGVRIRLK